MSAIEANQDNSIFKLDNLDDLKEDLKQEVKSQLKKFKKNKISKATKEMLSLFDIKNTLSVDEIIIGLARKYGVTKKRNTITSTLHNLTRTGVLKRKMIKNESFYEKIIIDENDKV